MRTFAIAGVQMQVSATGGNLTASHERESGLRGLGPPLKSFRDRVVDFPLYRDPAGTPYLQGPGPLSKPHRDASPLNQGSVESQPGDVEA